MGDYSSGDIVVRPVTRPLPTLANEGVHIAHGLEFLREVVCRRDDAIIVLQCSNSPTTASFLGTVCHMLKAQLCQEKSLARMDNSTAMHESNVESKQCSTM